MSAPNSSPPRLPAYRPRNRRNVLCISPEYAPSFGTFQYAYKLFPDVQAFMPPQGLLLIAACLPQEWEVRFIDENIRTATTDDIDWADVVFISGMHVQREYIIGINRRAHAQGKTTVLGGPSVSASPEQYPDVDILHLGELGDATEAVIAWLDVHAGRPARQLVFRTQERHPLQAFPRPAYRFIDASHYFLGSIQFSSGCPYRCEFCDIPALYGRNPRLKTPLQICRELDALLASGARGTVYFVDDNFIANKNAARDLLPHLLAWQEARGYPLRFACEATLNIARMPELLSMMREARFHTVFIGIETPEEHALRAMLKTQNLRLPVLEAVEILNQHGLEIVSGIIMGLDTDTAYTGQRILRFIEISKIPLLTINLLYALPKTPLYDRLRREGRLVSPEVARARVSNVQFLLPYDEVVAMWFDTITTAYEPSRLLQRFRHQTEHTFPHRKPVSEKPAWDLMRYGLQVMGRVLWHCGVKAKWRSEFWDLCWPLLRQGRIEEVIHIAGVSYHLIAFTDQIRRGGSEACFYREVQAGVNIGRGVHSPQAS